MKTVMVDLGDRSYPIHIGYDLLPRLGEYLREHSLGSEIFVISDDNVARLYQDRISVALKNAGLDAPFFTIPAGERSKSLEIADQLYSSLISHQATRNATIIAFGGGVVGDLAGFIAATYLRGVQFVQMPTTILAQVDSSVGGKVGVNHRLGKNLIGAFHQPVFVLIDPSLLTTLPQREVLAGLAEVIKYGFIWDGWFFDLLNSQFSSIVGLADANLIETVLETCCKIKAEVVRQDERESGLRAILNFGHTIGHALESATGYETFLHGEAILHGMRGAVYLSQVAGRLPQEEAQIAQTMIRHLLPPIIPKTVSVDDLLSDMQQDKKRSTSGQLWILLDGIGHAVMTRDVSPQQVRQAVEFVLAE